MKCKLSKIAASSVLLLVASLVSMNVSADVAPPEMPRIIINLQNGFADNSLNVYSTEAGSSKTTWLARVAKSQYYQTELAQGSNGSIIVALAARPEAEIQCNRVGPSAPFMCQPLPVGTSGKGMWVTATFIRDNVYDVRVFAPQS